jgi:hypothetical protein
VSPHRFERQRHTLSATDAEGDAAAFQAVTPHRVDQSHREDRAGGPDRVAVGDGAALDVDQF